MMRGSWGLMMRGPMVIGSWCAYQSEGCIWYHQWLPTLSVCSPWVPPKRLAIDWHPGHDPEQASQVSVEFTAVGDQTLVVLEHAGWERFADAVAARQEYDRGWPRVLSRYSAAVGGTTAPTADAPKV